MQDEITQIMSELEKASYKYLPKILKNQAVLLAYDFFDYWQYHATIIAYQNDKLYKPQNNDELGILRLQVAVKE
jgi:ADP-glucose pyrophosphorylase